MIAIILILIYLVSIFGNYKWVQKAYSKNGIFENNISHGYNITFSNIFETFCPVYNTVSFIIDWLFRYPIKKKIKIKKDIDYNKFFRIK